MGLAVIISVGSLLRLSITTTITSLGDQERTPSVSSCLLQSQKRLAPELASKEVREVESPPKSLSRTLNIDVASEAAVEADPGTFRNCLPPDTSPAHQNLTFEGYTDHQHGYQGLFVYPPKKFAFCLMEKNGCSTWIRKIFQPLFYKNEAECNDAAVNGCLDGKDYKISERSQREFGTPGIESIFQDPAATRAVFVREPLERFASAFINKCIDEDWSHEPHGGGNCPMKSKVFKDAVEWALTNDMTSVEGHWLPQALHCQLHNRIRGYNAVILMNRDTFSHDMNCLLARAGLTDFINDTQPNLLPSNRSGNVTTVLQKLFTPQAARNFIQKVSFDYDVFGFSKEPEWINAATGEWYEKEPSPVQASIQSTANLRRPTESLVDEDHDDLVELAFRAGYGV